MTDSLSLAQYRDIYATVRGGRTLRGVVSTLKPHGCTLSIAAWSKIERDLLGLNLEARNALRRFAGLPDVPPTPAEIVTNAGVERVMVAGPGGAGGAPSKPTDKRQRPNRGYAPRGACNTSYIDKETP